MKKTKFIFLLLALAMVLSVVGCSSKNDSKDTSSSEDAASIDEENVSVEQTSTETSDDAEVPEKDPTVIKVGGLKGATSIGMVKLMKDSQNGVSLNNYEFVIEAGADSLSPAIIKGELDIAAVPANLASVLYNKTKGKVKILAVNTLGVLYIVNRGEKLSLEDLKGKTLYATGKGAVPEYALRYVLSQNGIDADKDLTIEWKSQPEEVVAVLSSDENAVAMLPQPFVTVASTKVQGLNVSIDLTAEWDKLGVDSRLITGTLVVRSEFAEKHPELIEKFLNEYKASTEYVNSNVEDAALLVEEFGIVKAAVAKIAIPHCNIVYISGEDMIAPVNGYLKTVMDQNPTAIGESMPKEDFYYVSK